MSIPASPHLPISDAATLGRILDGVADGITVQEPVGRLTYANAAAARVLGYDSADALLAAPMSEAVAQFEILDEAGQPGPLGDLPGRLVLLGAPAAEATLGYRMRATGVVHWALVRARPFMDPDGHASGVVNLFHDLTAQRTATLVQAAAATRAMFLLGMGIGLYLVRAIVERHGGTVAVTSQEGQGSTFTVLLPRLAAGADPAPARADG